MNTTRSKRKEKSVKIPIIGNSDHNSGFYLVIGGLVVSWANSESVFLAMMQAFVSGGERTASIIWHSLRTTQGRLDLISKLAREQIGDKKLLADIDKAISKFKGHTGTRNFFCHATYNYDSELRLESVQGISLAQDGHPLRAKNKRMDAETANEIGHALVELAKLNRVLWALIPRIESELGVQRVKIPLLPPVDQQT